jgi:ankyrin repeat protein
MPTTTSLLHAVSCGNTEKVRLLLEKGASPMLPAGQKQPIHEAAARGFASIVELLLNQGANPFILDDCGRNCYQYGKAYPTIIQILEHQN